MVANDFEDSEYHQLLQKAWDGEVTGVALFDALCEYHPAHEPILRLLQKLEDVTEACAAQVGHDSGLAASPDSQRKAVEIAQRIGGKPWTIMWEEMLPLVCDDLVDLQRLRELAKPVHHERCDQLVEHEAALIECGRRLMATSATGDAAEPINAYLAKYE
jgi:hypothetical protein